MVEACRNSGYRRVFVSDPFLKKMHYSSGLDMEGRLMVRNSMDAATLRGWLMGRNRRFGRAWIRSRATAGLRAVIGDNMYSRLWRVLGSAPECKHKLLRPGDASE